MRDPKVQTNTDNGWQNNDATRRNMGYTTSPYYRPNRPFVGASEAAIKPRPIGPSTRVSVGQDAHDEQPSAASIFSSLLSGGPLTFSANHQYQNDTAQRLTQKPSKPETEQSTAQPPATQQQALEQRVYISNTAAGGVSLSVKQVGNTWVIVLTPDDPSHLADLNNALSEIQHGLCAALSKPVQLIIGQKPPI